MNILKNKHIFKIYVLLIHFFVFGQFAYASHLHLDSDEDQQQHVCAACVKTSNEQNDNTNTDDTDTQNKLDTFLSSSHIFIEINSLTELSMSLYRESIQTNLKSYARHPRGPPSKR